MSRGAKTCGAMARIPAGAGAAVADGTEVRTFCKTVGLLTAAVVPVVTTEVTTCTLLVCNRGFVESSLLSIDPKVTAVGGATVAGLPPLCEEMMGVCIGGLTSVTVGTLFTEG